jgi:putative ABC transport system permease protein
MSLWLRQEGYDGEAARTFWTRLLERTATLPGVESVALSSALPPLSPDFGWGTMIEGFVPVEGGPILAGRWPNGQLTGMIDHYLVVSPGYFDALRVKLVAGRLFDARDDARGAKAVIVNETFARAVWGEASALGKHIVPAFSPTPDDPFTVVGVISDVKNVGIEKPTGTALYLPYTQVPATTGLLRAPYVTVRSSRAPDAVADAMRAALRDVDPTLPLAEIRTLDDVVAASQSRPRFMTLVLTSFGSVSLLLAAVGIFGVISCSVAQRTRELGIRMALGAQARGVLRLVLGGALRLVAAGVLFGLVGAFALTRFLSAFLFGVRANDPVTFAVVALVLGAVALLASYLPAWRATRIDPLAALRCE